MGASDGAEELLVTIRGQKRVLEAEIEALRREVTEIRGELDILDELADEDEGGDEGDAAARKMKEVRRLFNKSPKKGVALWIEEGLGEDTADAIARFLLDTEGLKKGAIGEYLGDGGEKQLAVLKSFTLLFDFAGQDFDRALRAYLWSFRLPGEAQKIDRMMESFAGRFCDCNPHTFSHPDTCYVLAFSTIMLNTALHNPSVKQKQNLASFLSMNRGIDQGKDLPEELLTNLFASIETTPFKIPEDADGESVTFFNPERQGWLVKEGGQGMTKNWKKRWFTLCNNCLYYFESEKDLKPKGTIPLENLVVREMTTSKRPNCFEILCEEGATVKAAKQDSKGQLVKGRHTSYKICAKDRTEMEEWIKCVRAAMQKDPVYEMYRLRKMALT